MQANQKAFIFDGNKGIQLVKNSGDKILLDTVNQVQLEAFLRQLKEDHPELPIKNSEEV